MLRFLTAGESHGKGLVAIVEGLPAGLRLDFDQITRELRRRQAGYGRGRRMTIESDRADILSGVRLGQTTGAPVALLIPNRDWDNWQRTMHVDATAPPEATGAKRDAVVRPRPGHADLAGAIKFDHDDMRDVLERASARETAARVAVGALARQLLAHFGTSIASHVVRIGDVAASPDRMLTYVQVQEISEESLLRCADALIEGQMMLAIDRARERGDTLGGAFEVIAHGVPPGLGSYTQWDRKLDGRLAQAVMSIPAIKAVGIGVGTDVAHLPGSAVHDEIVVDVSAATGARAVARPTNRAGGLEGGVTNGEDVRLTGYMKPISTLMRPLRSVDLKTLEDAPAAIERSDVCAVPAAGIVAEAMVAFVLADAAIERFGGDSIRQMEAHWREGARVVAGRLTRPALAKPSSH